MIVPNKKVQVLCGIIGSFTIVFGLYMAWPSNPNFSWWLIFAFLGCPVMFWIPLYIGYTVREDNPQ